MVDVEEEVFGATHEEGAYDCVLKSITKVESEKEPGNYFRVWTFGIVDTTEELSGTTSTLMTPKSKAYQWATALNGGKAPSGLTLLQLLGRKCIVTINSEEKIESLHPVITRPAKKLAEAFDGDDPR